MNRRVASVEESKRKMAAVHRGSSFVGRVFGERMVRVEKRGYILDRIEEAIAALEDLVMPTEADECALSFLKSARALREMSMGFTVRREGCDADKRG